VRADPGREKVFSELDLLSSSETGIVSLTVTDSTFR
jgi:hypothetical protein